MKKAYKYKLKPTKQQRKLLERYFGCARYVYNWALGRKKEAYENDKTSLSYKDLCNELTLLKKEEGKEWLKEVLTQSLQQSIRNMCSAYERFFREKKGYPKFKSKKFSKQSLKFPQNVTIDFNTHRIFLPKIGSVKFFKSRTFNGNIKTVTVSKTPAGTYFVSVLVDDSMELPTKMPVNEDTAIGIDVGIKSFAVMSDGKVCDNPKYYEGLEKRLAVLQKRLSRKQKGSNRREKARKAVAKLHERIKNRRANFLHQLSSALVRENQTIIVEDLNVKGMLTNHKLAKHIASASWSEFTRQLEYKCEWNGKNFLKIGRFEASSQTCSNCGYVNKDVKNLNVRKWTCPQCGTKHDRDLNASYNIKYLGLAKLKKTPVVDGEGTC